MALKFINDNGREGGRKSQAEQDKLRAAAKATAHARKIAKADKINAMRAEELVAKEICEKALVAIVMQTESQWSSCNVPFWPPGLYNDRLYTDSTYWSTLYSGNWWQDESGKWWQELFPGWWTGEDNECWHVDCQMTTTAVLLRGAVDG